MFTKNIKFENFSGKKNIKLEKTFKKLLNYAELLKNGRRNQCCIR